MSAVLPEPTRCPSCGDRDRTTVCRYCKTEKLPPRVRCIAPGGMCPVFGCEAEGECYLWRCEHPRAPSPKEAS